MGKFFDSEIIQKELHEINELQDSIYKGILDFPLMDREAKIEHIELLTELIEKQKIMYTRVSLSDDPEALQIKENIVNAAKMLGFPGSVDPGDLFNNMHMTIKNLRNMVDKGKA